MGMYTEFHFNSALLPNTPQEVIELLQYMLGEIDTHPSTPSHTLFLTPRWPFMLQGDSAYFDTVTDSKLIYEYGQYYLSIRCNFKNYGEEIMQFVDWIHPYLDKLDGDFLGFSRYEESNEPYLIYYEASDD